MIFFITTNNIIMSSQKKKVNPSDEGESKAPLVDEEAPEYRVITRENMYEFILWCNELKPPSIEVNQFNMMIQSFIEQWIHENNITWQFGYTFAMDSLRQQKNIADSLNEKSYQERIKPDSIEDKRRLFAKKAEERQKNRWLKKAH